MERMEIEDAGFVVVELEEMDTWLAKATVGASAAGSVPPPVADDDRTTVGLALVQRPTHRSLTQHSL
jgi:hypothetical protein